MSSSLKRFIVLALAGIIPIVVVLQLPMGTWADFAGLPNHPLVVHLVVVLLPVVAIWTVLAAVKPVVLERTFPYLFAAAVIGGTSLAGGVGTIVGAMLGALIMQSLQSGMVLLGVDTPLQNIVVGIVLVMAIWLDGLYRRRIR